MPTSSAKHIPITREPAQERMETVRYGGWLVQVLLSWRHAGDSRNIEATVIMLDVEPGEPQTVTADQANEYGQREALRRASNDTQIYDEAEDE